MSTNGPAAIPAGFHQVALLSDATATNAPPMPSARLPALSTICAWADETPIVQTSAKLVRADQTARL
jgi:hypothetical protein